MSDVHPDPNQRGGTDVPQRPRSSRRPLGRRTTWWVHVVDFFSRWIITVGGIGTIAAIMTVGLFLVWVVVPMFLPANVSAPKELPVAVAGGETPAKGEASLWYTATNEHVSSAWGLTESGTLIEFRLDSGAVLNRRELFPEKELTAFAYSAEDGTAAFGFGDGSLALGRIRFASEFLDAEAVPEELRGLKAGALAAYQGGVVERTPEGQYRVEQLRVEIDPPASLGEHPIRLLSVSVQPSGYRVAAVADDGVLYVRSVREKKNLLTGEKTLTLSGGDVPLRAAGHAGLPDYLALSGLGDNAYVVWEDGTLLRFNTRSVTQPELAETVRVLRAPSARVTAVQFLLGRTTLLIGDDRGGVTGWFCIKPDDATTPDGAHLVAAHRFRGTGYPVTALASSARDRVFAAGYADGTVRLYHATAEQLVAEVPGGEPVQRVGITPKDDGLFTLSGDMWRFCRVDAPHAGITWKRIFGRVWYEGYNEPDYVWQSSSGTDDFEPKFSLVPLIFGTIKATFYSLLLGVPLALLAAVYSSEFLSRRTKQRVKPLIEMMASLPSVVLGFLAALVFAPLVAKIVPHTLAFLVLVPYALLLAGYLWHLVPQGIALRLARFRLWLALPVLAAAAVGSMYSGPLVERLVFAGDLEAWLDGRVGSAVGGWTYLCLPVSALLVALGVGRWVNRPLRTALGHAPRTVVALAELAKFLAATLCVLAVAGAAAWGLTALGWDPRDSFFGTYVQRNALVVGFAMAFAIIPIIYTIADDALTAVPDHLRAASLGAGATPWQTAVRIVIPTAASGLFSAVMIGLGRAVGETMIVLMAAGNTPIMEWNIFNGFRTLSANIAVELPEAVQNSTHYRMLFLAALVLFVMTFVVNTLAEVVRLRFRKKAVQL